MSNHLKIFCMLKYFWNGFRCYLSLLPVTCLDFSFTLIHIFIGWGYNLFAVLPSDCLYTDVIMIQSQVQSIGTDDYGTCPFPCFLIPYPPSHVLINTWRRPCWGQNVVIINYFGSVGCFCLFFWKRPHSIFLHGDKLELWYVFLALCWQYFIT